MNRRAAVVLIAAVIVSACGDSKDQPEQLTIGLVTNNTNGLRNVHGFIDGMAEAGYREGERVDYVFAGGPVRGTALDAELQHMVDKEVDLIFTAGTPTGVAAHRVTSGTGIPVVFGVIADPIAAGVMTDLTRPGGNMTGVRLSRSQDRRLELFLEIAPDVERIFVPYNPDDSAASSAVQQIAGIAPDLGAELILGEARNDGEMTGLLASIPDDVDAVFLVPDSVVNSRLQDIVAVSIGRRLPVSGPSTAQVEEGALSTYGFVHHAAGAQAAAIAVQVINGTEPAVLPVQTTEFYLGINLATAEAIGLQIPESILNRADIIVRPDSSASE